MEVGKGSPRRVVKVGNGSPPRVVTSDDSWLNRVQGPVFRSYGSAEIRNTEAQVRNSRAVSNKRNQSEVQSPSGVKISNPVAVVVDVPDEDDISIEPENNNVHEQFPGLGYSVESRLLEKRPSKRAAFGVSVGSQMSRVNGSKCSSFVMRNGSRLCYALGCVALVLSGMAIQHYVVEPKLGGNSSNAEIDNAKIDELTAELNKLRQINSNLTDMNAKLVSENSNLTDWNAMLASINANLTESNINLNRSLTYVKGMGDNVTESTVLIITDCKNNGTCSVSGYPQEASRVFAWSDRLYNALYSILGSISPNKHVAKNEGFIISISEAATINDKINDTLGALGKS